MDKFNTFLRDELGEEIGRVFFHFLENLNGNKIFDSKKYTDISIKNQVKEMIRTSSSTFYINFEYVIQFSDELADVIEEQYYRIEPYICESIYEFFYENNLFEIFLEKNFPKKFWIGFFNLPKTKSIEKLNSVCFNKLNSISGIVTSITEPYPEISFGTFECQNNNCKLKLNFFEQHLIYTEPKICPKCYNLTTWTLLFDDTIFIFLQKIKIQESKSINFGSIFPKTLDILLREDNVGIVKLGDNCLFTGSLLTLPNQRSYFDIRKRNRFTDFLFTSDSDAFLSFLGEVYYETYFLVSHVFLSDFRFYRGLFSKDNFSTTFFSPKFSRKEKEKILKLRIKKRLFNNLISSLNLGYENFENVKIGILLLLVGGVKKSTLEKINLRGNIHICLIGNSWYDKNKLLKRLIQFCPKNVFVNGNAFAAGGMTASISKDSETDKFFIKGGALVLCDRGVCCINDLDQIRSQDQTLICEVMEQQTISILKNGIKTILISRPSVLATMKLSEEKYQEAKIFNKKFKLSTYIFSKFDLIFSIDDCPGYLKDLKLSEDILSLNKKIKQINNRQDKSLPLNLYISFARCLSPILKYQSGILLVRIYKYLKKCQFFFEIKKKILTIRHLESLIRLSESFSKIYLGIFVKVFHVKAAARLFFSCFYPCNFSSKKDFLKNPLLKSTITNGHKKKSKPENRNIFHKKKRIKISFQEYDLISKNILAEIKHLENKGIEGSTLKMLTKRLLKNEYFLYSPQNEILKIQKIVMVIRFMVFSKGNFLVTKSFQEVKTDKEIRLFYSK